MRRHWKIHGLNIAAIAVFAIAALGLAVMLLWNWLMPEIFALRTITFWQALGLFVLAKILFGAFHPRHSHKFRPRFVTGWGRLTDEERQKFWAQLTDEERQKFRSRLGREPLAGPMPESPKAL
jgi:hypothetical protein